MKLYVHGVLDAVRHSLRNISDVALLFGDGKKEGRNERAHEGQMKKDCISLINLKLLFINMSSLKISGTNTSIVIYLLHHSCVFFLYGGAVDS